MKWSRVLTSLLLGLASMTVGPAPARSQQVVDMTAAIESVEPGIVQIEVRLPSAKREQSASPVPARAATRTALAWLQAAQAAGPEYRLPTPTGKSQLSNYQTGICLGPNGEVLTVLGNRPKEGVQYRIHTQDRQKIDAQVLVYDAVTGCTLLKLDKPHVAAVPVQVAKVTPPKGTPVAAVWARGQGVVVVGQGIVATAPVWSESLQTDWFETDVAVRPGAMGGALVNSQGELVGVLVAHRSADGRHGPALAIPAQSISRILEHDDGVAESAAIIYGGRLGVRLGEAVSDGGIRGVVVRVVLDGSAAAKAGIEAGDRISAVGSVSVQRTEQMLRELRRYRAGDRVTFQVDSDGGADGAQEVKALEIELQAAPLHDVVAAGPTQPALHAVPPGPNPTIYLTPNLNLPPSFTPAVPAAPAPGTSPVPPSTTVPHPPEAQGQETPKANEAFWQYHLGGLATQPRLKVERSNLEESIRELTKQIEDLKEELRKVQQ